MHLLEQEVLRLPDDIIMLYHLARTNIALGHFSEALPIILKAIEIKTPKAPDDLHAKLRVQLIRVYCELERWKDALEACAKAKIESPRDANILFLESNIWDKLGDLSKAQNCLLQLLQPPIRFSSQDLGLYEGKIRHNLGILYNKQGNVIEAEKQWFAIIKANPQFEPSWLALTDLLISQKRWEEVKRAIFRLETEFHNIELASKIKARLESANPL